MLVSSRKLPKLTMNGTLPSASRTFHDRGAEKTGLAPSTNNTCTGSSVDRQSGRHVTEPRRRSGGTGHLGCSGHVHLRREEQAARLLDAADERVQRVHRNGVEQSVGLRERSAADHRQRRRPLGELARQAFDTRGRHAGHALDVRGRVGGETAVPPVDERGGASAARSRPQLLAHDHVRKTEGEHPFRARLDRAPIRRRSRPSATSAIRPARGCRARRRGPVASRRSCGCARRARSTCRESRRQS